MGSVEALLVLASSMRSLLSIQGGTFTLQNATVDVGGGIATSTYPGKVRKDAKTLPKTALLVPQDGYVWQKRSGSHRDAQGRF